jgi:hypothetical protein
LARAARLPVISETSDHLQHSSRRFAARASVALSVQRRGYPRLAVACALTASAAIGLGCSIGLRHCGLIAMWLRYPLALAASYIVFVALLGMFVRRAARRLLEDQDQIRRDALRLQFHRNDSELPDPNALLDNVSEAAREAGRQEVDPRAAPLFLMLLLSITVILVCVYYIWMAPVLLADVAVEGALVGWLYRPRFRASGSGWRQVAFEQTGVPAFLLALAFAATGVGFQLYAPQATTVAEVWQHVLQQRYLAAAGQKVGRR